MTEQLTRVFAGVATSAAGVGMFIASAVNRDVFLAILGAVLFISGNQLIVWGKLAELIWKVNGPARAMWEDGVDYGESNKRRKQGNPVSVLRVVNLPDQ